MKYGIVYCLTNQAMPGLVKIGMTTREDLDMRMKELYTTGVPMPFEVAYACYIDNNRCGELEKALHKTFADCRVNLNREFFRVSPDKVIPLLQFVNLKDVTKEVAEEINNDLTISDKESLERAKQSKRPRFNFTELGLNVGDIIQWKHNEEITASVYTERTVLYKGEEYFLSKLSCDLHKEYFNKQWGCQYVAPCPEWLYNGVLLQTIYDEKHPIVE